MLVQFPIIVAITQINEREIFTRAAIPVIQAIFSTTVEHKAVIPRATLKAIDPILVADVTVNEKIVATVPQQDIVIVTAKDDVVVISPREGIRAVQPRHDVLSAGAEVDISRGSTPPRYVAA